MKHPVIAACMIIALAHSASSQEIKRVKPKPAVQAALIGLGTLGVLAAALTTTTMVATAAKITQRGAASSTPSTTSGN